MTNFKESLKNTPLFDYLEEKQNEEVATKLVSENICKVRNFYLVNFLMMLGIVISVSFMFFVQFNFDKLNDKITITQNQIEEYNDEIKLLEVEWYYLTRPSRLRFLADNYLKNSKVASYNQVKNFDKLEQIFLAKSSKNHNEVASLSK